MPEIIGFDHVYIAVSDLSRSERFYDRVMRVLGFRKHSFAINDDPHVQYYNRHFGYVLRPARVSRDFDSYAPGLHHLCFRVESVAEVIAVASELRSAGVDATDAALHPTYASDYWATFFVDPDGLRLEVRNYRQERRDRHDRWDEGAT